MSNTSTMLFSDFVRRYFPTQELSKQQKTSISRWAKTIGLDVQKVGKKLLVFYNKDIKLPISCPVNISNDKLIPPKPIDLEKIKQIIDEPTPLELANQYIKNLQDVIELLVDEVVRLREAQMVVFNQPSEKVITVLRSLNINIPGQ